MVVDCGFHGFVGGGDLFPGAQREATIQKPDSGSHRRRIQLDRRVLGPRLVRTACRPLQPHFRHARRGRRIDDVVLHYRAGTHARGRNKRGIDAFQRRASTGKEAGGRIRRGSTTGDDTGPTGRLS